jgi:hypothetical protein
MDLAVELKGVDEAEMAAAALGKAFDEAGLKTLLQTVAASPGIGAPGVGEVIASLCALVEVMLAARCCDRQAVAVHLQAWRLLLGAEPDADAKAALLQGLKAVRDLYAEPKAA